MDGTINGKSGQYVLLADYIVSSATTSVDFTGLNIGKEEEVFLVSTILNSSASTSEYYLFVNGNTTTSNYYSQELYANGSAYGANRYNVPRIANLVTNGSSLSSYNIKLMDNGYIVWLSAITRSFMTTAVNRVEIPVSSTFTVSVITSLRVTSNQSNAIGIGSRFQLYKVAQ